MPGFKRDCISYQLMLQRYEKNLGNGCMVTTFFLMFFPDLYQICLLFDRYFSPFSHFLRIQKKNASNCHDGGWMLLLCIVTLLHFLHAMHDVTPSAVAIADRILIAV